MRILVTGAAGMIGSHLVDALILEHDVIGVDDLSFGNVQNLSNNIYNGRFRLFKEDIEHCKLDQFGHVDVIFHLASLKKSPNHAVSSASVMVKNSDMMKNVIDIAAYNNSFLIFASTSDVYGNSCKFSEQEPVTIGPPTIPRFSYAMSKLYNEQLLMNYIFDNKIKGLVLRIFGCFSERSNRGWSGGHIPIFIDQALQNKDIIIHGSGNQTRSMSYINDIIYGLLSVVKNINILNGYIINLGSSEEMSVIDCAKLIISLSGSKSHINFIDAVSIHGNYPEIQRRFANVKLAESLLGYKTTMSTAEGIQKVISAWKK